MTSDSSSLTFSSSDSRIPRGLYADMPVVFRIRMLPGELCGDVISGMGKAPGSTVTIDCPASGRRSMLIFPLNMDLLHAGLLSVSLNDSTEVMQPNPAATETRAAVWH